MITLTIIIIIFVIIVSNTKDKRSPDADEKIQELPPIHFHSLQHDSSKRLLTGELMVSDYYILSDFNYENGILTLTTKKGEKLSGQLTSMEVRFIRDSGKFFITVVFLKNQLQFYKVGNFTEDQWEIMTGVLMLAGTTYGSGEFKSFSKAANRTEIALKILSKLT